MSEENKSKNNKLKTWVILLLSFGAAIALVIYIARHQAAVEAFIRDLGVAGPLLILVLYLVLAASPIPADTLTIINGAIFGPVWGALLAWVGMVSSAILEYYIGTRIGSAVNFQDNLEDLPFGLGKLPANSIWFLIGGRMLTGAGSKVVSYLSGIYRTPMTRYLWTTAVAMLWGSILFALGGFGILQLF